METSGAASKLSSQVYNFSASWYVEITCDNIWLCVCVHARAHACVYINLLIEATFNLEFILFFITIQYFLFHKWLFLSASFANANGI